MNGRTLTTLLLVLLGIGCAPKPPPPKPPPPVEEPPPPPPPPKCEALEEDCVAKTGQRATIKSVDWTIVPPEGWKFAAEAEQVVALSEAAALGLMTFETKPDKKPASIKAMKTKRDEVVARLSEKLGVVRAKKVTFPPKPQKTSKVRGIDLALYQFDGAKRSGEAGPLLVFVAQILPERMLVGVAFVAEKDTTNADAAILRSIESLEPVAADADAGAAPAK